MANASNEAVVISYTVQDRDMIRDIHNVLFVNGFIATVKSNTEKISTIERTCHTRTALGKAKDKKSWMWFTRTVAIVNVLFVATATITKLAGVW